MKIRFETVPFIGYNLFTGDLGSITLNGRIEINTINQYSYCIAEEDQIFKNALQGSDVLLPDGVGITWASNFLNGRKVNKIAGADIHLNLLERLNAMRGSCFYLGASEKTLEIIVNRLKLEYPYIKVETYSPPYKDTFTIEDSNLMIRKVNDFEADVLFVGMTAPKQEKWSHHHKNRIDANVICSIGAVFDFYAGSVNRPSKIWVNLKLEWLGRLLKEPRRMWKRYLFYGGVFVYDILKKKIKVKK